MAKVDLLTEHLNMPRFMINVESVGLSPEQFFQLCRDNPDRRIEMTAQKELVIMSPTAQPTSIMNAEITCQLVNWANEDGRGYAFDSNVLFVLRNGARRSGFLLYPPKRQVWIYRLNEASEKLDNPDFVSGDPVLPGFQLNLAKIWR
jgi:Uma2 family endonuclease